MTAWPSSIFATPVLRGLDAAGQDAVIAAGRLLDRDGVVYREGDASESLFVVVAGAVELSGVRRGDAGATVLRTARAGDSFGEEAMLPGLPRRVTARAAGARLAEVPIAVLLRALGRTGGDAAGAREARYVERAAVRDLIAQSALGRELAGDDLELLLDGVALRRHARGERLYEAGDRAEHAFLVVEGLVQLQDDGDRPSVLAYLGRGDAVGDDEALAGLTRVHAAVAAGDTWCAVVPRAVLRTLADRNPGLAERLRRVADATRSSQGAMVAAASARSTQHVFKDLYRLQIARSLLVIDQDSCVRCGHCAWSCAEVHGVSRLERRGDKCITPVGDGRAASLLLPNTCQHCRHAACMIDCPTGAIGRDPTGEVFIRPELCTGCGNCVRGCPWDNIQLAPRATARRSLPVVGGAAVPSATSSAATLLGLSKDVAVKCDLCRDYQAPACVEACPTGSLVRIDPSRDIAEVAQVLGAVLPRSPTEARAGDGAPTLASLPARRTTHAVIGALAVVAALVLGAVALRAAWQPGHGAGLAAGIVGAIGIVALAAYVVPKRLVRARLRRRAARDALIEADRAPPRSRTRGPLAAHVLVGLVVPAAVLAHAGARVPPSAAGALTLAFALATIAGLLGALAYRAIPRALTRLERTGALPEDLAGHAADLRARLYREASGASELVKHLAARILTPYARAPLGWIALVASGRTLGEEERRLRARIDRVLAGRGQGRLHGLDALCRLSVELRALPGRRALMTAVRAWLPLHVIAAAMTVALLAVHVVTAVLP